MVITLVPLITGQERQSYIWSPANKYPTPGLSQSLQPAAAIGFHDQVYVTGTDNRCSAIDSVIVKVSATGIPVFSIPNALLPNNDGKNDCFGIRRWGNVKVIFSYIQQVGTKVFSTTSPSGC